MDLVVVGPEAPLVAGVADAVRAAGVACFGPSAEAARIEGSKAFAKEVMAEAGAPTAQSYLCTSQAEAEVALKTFGPPYVVKNDGLAAGKGVVVTDDYDVALAHAVDCGRIVIEEYLDGPELSLFVVTDGTAAVPLPLAQDYKRVGDGDTGPNTGGMGAYAPIAWAPPDLVPTVMSTVVEPVLAAMARRGHPFVGLLYVGLALTSKGPKVVEFNARFGDPETQVILPLLESSPARLLYAAATGTPGTAAAAAMASGCGRDRGHRLGRLPDQQHQGRRHHRRGRTGVHPRRHPPRRRRCTGHHRWAGAVRHRRGGHGRRGARAGVRLGRAGTA